MARAVVDFLIRLAGMAVLFLAGRQSKDNSQLKVDNANLNEQAQDWANRPRSDDDVINRLRKASAERKD